MDELLDTVVDAEQVHDSFRLWMTTEEHVHFPIGLLQVCDYSTIVLEKSHSALLTVSSLWVCNFLKTDIDVKRKVNESGVYKLCATDQSGDSSTMP